MERVNFFRYVNLDAGTHQTSPAASDEVNHERGTVIKVEREFASLSSPIGRPSIPPEKLLPRCCCRPLIRSARSDS